MTDPQEVWRAVLDNKWVCKVVRDGDYKGVLTVGLEGEEPVLSQEVGLAYNAMFGPDIFDVTTWQKVAQEKVDTL